MKRLLTLLALAGLSAGAFACGDDSGEDDPKPTPTNDAGTKDAAVVRPQQIDSDSLGDKCTAATDCKGAGALECLTELGDQELEGGYCTAQCNAAAECGNGGACPVADIAANPLFGQLAGLLGGLLPQNCVLKCTADDAGGRGSCERSDHVCRSIVPANLATGPAAGIVNGIPALKQTYCFPPIEIQLPDGGAGDAGARALIVNGLDAGL